MSKQEQNAYEKYLHDVASFMLTQKVERELALQEGEAIGLEKGEAIGDKKRAYKTARGMLAKNMDIADIIEFTDLTMEEIESIRLGIESSKDNGI